MCVRDARGRGGETGTGWVAYFKSTGYPNTSTLLEFEKFTAAVETSLKNSVSYPMSFDLSFFFADSFGRDVAPPGGKGCDLKDGLL